MLSDNDTALAQTKLNKCDISVSQICLGTNQFGTTMDQAAVDDLLDYFVAAGGNFLDTARTYGDSVPTVPPGASERAIGSWLGRRQRDGIVVATKGGMADKRKGDNLPRATPTEITRDLFESLDHLKIDVVDLYYIHKDDPSQPIEPLIDMLIEHQEAGRIREFALSNWSPARLDEACAYAASIGHKGPVALEPFWGLAEPDRPLSLGIGYGQYYEDGYRPIHETGLTMIPYCAQSQGFFTKLAHGEETLPPHLAKLYVNPENRRRLVIVEDLALKYEATINQVMLAYLLCQPLQTIPIIGSRSVVQLEESIAAATVQLTADDIDRLRLGA